MLTLTKKELISIGFGPSQSADIIRRSKRLMVSKGFLDTIQVKDLGESLLRLLKKFWVYR